MMSFGTWPDSLGSHKFSLEVQTMRVTPMMQNPRDTFLCPKNIACSVLILIKMRKYYLAYCRNG